MDEIEERDAIHTHFGLSYASYLVLHRTLLQSMPDEWQARFVGMLRDLDEAFGHIERADCYEVTPGEEREIGELTDAEMKFLGVTPPDPIDTEDDDEWTRQREAARWLYRGEEYESWHRIVFPKAESVPHYNRGRTRIEPRLREGAADTR